MESADPGQNGRHSPDEAEQAAELGLAQAVLAWRQPDSDGFERFARAAITSELERVVDRGPIRRRRTTSCQATANQPRPFPQGFSIVRRRR